MFRGINVGGKAALPMAELTKLLEACGYTGIKTYIQSGNVVFRSSKTEADKLPERIGKAVSSRHGFRPEAIVLGVGEIERAVVSNPFPEAEAEPKSLHLYFLERSPPNPNLEAMSALKAASESFATVDKVFYLHAPDGFGRSKLAARAEKLIGVGATARNWRTVNKILELAKASE